MAGDNLRFNISTDDVDRAVDEEFENIDDALDDSAQELRKEGLEAAKDHIRAHDKVWTNELLNSWTPLQIKSNLGGVKQYGWQSNAEHAGIVDKGATYKGKGPPVHALMPWVVDNLPVGQFGMSAKNWAFWLQAKIKADGIEGINFTEVAVSAMHAQANAEIAKQVRKNTS